MDHVLGYAVGLDLTLRDLQAEAKKTGAPWDVAKGFDGAAPVSNVVLRDAAGDAGALALTLDVNGTRRQEGSTSRMLHPVPALIALASRVITLERGDLLFTGTPSGVGPVVAGDRLEARLGDLVRLEVTIERES
jgi:2-keto-4-pentenoate hydratase/2-oxohepta-3-ene-1,7-dioic acid hydratase in catechol pathway